jgi:hypothetical protein
MSSQAATDSKNFELSSPRNAKATASSNDGWNSDAPTFFPTFYIGCARGGTFDERCLAPEEICRVAQPVGFTKR